LILFLTEQITKEEEKGEPFDGKDTGICSKQMYTQEVSGVRFVQKPHYADILKVKKAGYKKIF
jgi:hypothetical protein